MLPLALALAPSLARPVTFDKPAMPLARLLPALGRSAGVDLAAAGNVAKDVALIKVKDAPLGEILRRLAEEDGAEVEATKTGFRIVKTPASERKERQAALAGRVASLRLALDQTAKSLALPADEAAYRALYPKLAADAKANRGGGWVRSGTDTPRARMPLNRAAMRAVQAIPVEILADLQEGDRIVYSSRPTRLQRPMPALNAIMKSFAKEQGAWAAAAAKSPPVEPGDYTEDPFRNVAALDGPPGRAVLTLSRGNSADAALVRIVMLDARGEDLGMASYGIASREMQDGMAELQKPTDPTPVPTSPETRTLMEGLPRMGGGGAPVATPAAVALLSQPETRDPLSFGATDLVRDMAGERPLVAVLPDPAWLSGLLAPGGLKRSDRGFLGSLVAAREDDGWLLVHPREPETARRNRVDRAALGRFVRTVVAQRRVPLDAYAAYAWTASEAPSDVVGVFVAMMLEGGTFNPDVDWRVLRLYGSLSPTDRQTMVAGGKKGWATLSKAQRSLASWIVNHGVGSLQGEVGREYPSINLMMEPTELFAAGYDGLEIGLSKREDSPLLCDSTTKNVRMGWRRIIEPGSVGDYLAMPDGPNFDRYGVARRTTYGLSVSARKGVSTGAQLEDVVPPTAPLRPLSELPEPIRTAIEASRLEAERRKGTGTGSP